MEENVYEVSFLQLIRVVMRHWWIILIAVLLGVALAVSYVKFFMEPTYTTYAKVGVTTPEMSEYQQALLGNSLANESADILVSNITLQKAADKLNEYYETEKYTPDKIYSMLKTETYEKSRYFDVTVKSSNRDEAKKVCEYVVESFEEVLAEENFFNEAEGKVIHHPDEAKLSSTSTLLAAVIGGLVAFALSFGVLMVVNFAKDALDGEDWLIEAYRDKIPMLSIIPDANGAGRAYRRYYSKYGYRYQ